MYGEINHLPPTPSCLVQVSYFLSMTTPTMNATVPQHMHCAQRSYRPHAEYWSPRPSATTTATRPSTAGHSSSTRFRSVSHSIITPRAPCQQLQLSRNPVLLCTNRVSGAAACCKPSMYTYCQIYTLNLNELHCGACEKPLQI